MLCDEAREEITSVRTYARSLGLRPNPLFSIRGALVERGFEVEAALEDGRRRSDFRMVHEALESSYQPANPGLTEYGREVIVSEGAAEVWCPAEEAREVVREHGWDVQAIRMRFAEHGLSWEMAARRLPRLALEEDVDLTATIVDDGRVHWRRSSRDAYARWMSRDILVPELRAWLECVRSDPRVEVERSYSICHEWMRIAPGRMPPMPDLSAARELPDEACDLVSVRVHVWPVPPLPRGEVRRREIIVATVDA